MSRARPRVTPALLALAPIVALFAAHPCRATGFTDLGQDLVPRPQTTATIDGYLRLRFEALYNLDLDRGLTPSGRPLFPVPLGDPNGQLLTTADMRLRTDVALYPSFGSMAVKVRVDVIDDLALGGDPVGLPPATTSQAPPDHAFRIKRAFGQALLPIGLLAAGRMGNHFGLGMLANGGDCPDCDSGDAADRVALLSPLFGHIFAFAYDFSAIGPTIARPDGARRLDVDPGDDARTLTFAVLRWRDDRSLARRRAAALATLDYGVYFSHRWQSEDVPAASVPTAQPVPLTPAQVVHRGFSASALDGWLRLVTPLFRLEAEAAVLGARLEQPSLVPGVLLRDAIESLQIGAALESELAPQDGLWGLGLDLGFASGDPAPGFGAFAPAYGRVGAPGELDGVQADPPRDTRIDNFRFHPDYRIDRILFREIIGTVTDAFYLRPHGRLASRALGAGLCVLQLAAVASLAVEPGSTPGGRRPLGVEIDPTLGYESRDGFAGALEYALLLPLAGLDNPRQGQGAKPAQLVRLRLAYLF